MSWMDEWRKQDDKRRAAAQAAKFSPEIAPKRVSAGSAAEDLIITVMAMEEKYAGRWGFLDSIQNMGRRDERPKETSTKIDAQSEREETGSRGANTAGEPPEPIA